jgi:histidyl-tRNA synthetase
MSTPKPTPAPTPKPGVRRPGMLHPQQPEDEEDVRAHAPVKLIAQGPRGMADLLPAENAYWDVVMDAVRSVAAGFNMKYVAPPLLEEAAVFTKALGEATDVVEKEMFLVRDVSGKTRLVLRPEFTAGIIRAYLEHGMASWPQPVRLWYFGPVFRHDRPQAGRARQFSQFGVEVIGDVHPIIDAQVIHLAYEIYTALQLDAFRIEINTMGDLKANCRPSYMAALKAHAQENVRKLCTDCRRRMKTNPLRILDCKEEKCQLVANTAPKMADKLCDECKAHYRSVLQYLQELSIPFKENPRLVRGLDYYTRTVFEIVPTLPPAEGVSTASIGAGGRYDGLVELLGGPSTPAMGFSGGVERTILQMRAEGVEVNVDATPDVFLAHLGDLGRRKSLTLFDDLRRAGIRVAEAFHKEGIKAQLRTADRLKVSWALILGQKEALDNTIILRNMESGMQETLDLNLDALVPALKKRLRHENGTAGR